jgi:predicted metalloprotease with PDZ domain
MPKTSALSSAPFPAAIHYRVEVADLHAHLFRITLTIASPVALQRVSLPVWIPGSYLVREFSKNLQGLKARQAGRALPTRQVQQQDKNSWDIQCKPEQALELTYEVYANDNSVRTAWLDAQRGFFNNTSLCLRVADQTDAPHGLEIVQSPSIASWSLATGLQPQKTNKQGFGHYLASSYEELVDCPVEMGHFWSGSFVACGIPHRFVVTGASDSFDGDKLLADTRKICETQIRFWHGHKKPPHHNYLFMLNAVDDGYGGLEHRNSTALICNRKDLPRLGESKAPEGYATLRGLISHEYFHTWNVKRLRPAEFSAYQYNSENYTQLLWFFEGFTSYYDDLMLRRCGLLDDAAYLKLLNKTINQVLQAPGRKIQSVARASYDAWVKYYRQDENTANATISYYTKGALVALCFDLTLRGESKSSAPVTLDDVMRRLWQRCDGGPMQEADFAATLQELGGRSYAKEIASWVHGTAELPLQALLQQHGVAVWQEPAQLAQALGLRVTETTNIVIKVVLRGGAAERAGFAAGDEWLGVETVSAGKKKPAPDTASKGWRLSKLDDLKLYVGHNKKVSALVSRDKRLLSLALTVPAAETTWRLVLKDADLAARWLNAKA